jgi:hypothetical protein
LRWLDGNGSKSISMSINLLGVISERERASWAARSLVRCRRGQLQRILECPRLLHRLGARTHVESRILEFYLHVFEFKSSKFASLNKPRKLHSTTVQSDCGVEHVSFVAVGLHVRSVANLLIFNVCVPTSVGSGADDHATDHNHPNVQHVP